MPKWLDDIKKRNMDHAIRLFGAVVPDEAMTAIILDADVVILSIIVGGPCGSASIVLVRVPGVSDETWCVPCDSSRAWRLGDDCGWRRTFVTIHSGYAERVDEFARELVQLRWTKRNIQHVLGPAYTKAGLRVDLPWRPK